MQQVFSTLVRFSSNGSSMHLRKQIFVFMVRASRRIARLDSVEFCKVDASSSFLSDWENDACIDNLSKLRPQDLSNTGECQDA